MNKINKDNVMSNATLNADVKCFAQSEGAEKEFDFELVGYTGKVMSQAGRHFIFDLEGIEAKAGGVIVLREHERDRIVGHGQVSVDERGLIVKGNFSKATPDGIEIKAILDEGIVPLQCSVGIAPKDIEHGDSDMAVNGVQLSKGIEVWKKSYVGEVSICSWGVDTDTSVKSFAKEIDMTEEIKKELEEKEEHVCECEGDCTCEKEEPEVKEEEVVEEEVVEEVVEEPKEEVKEEKELKFSQADLDAAVAGERSRVAAIFAADAPIELAREAIELGMDEGEAYKFFWKSEKGMKTDALAEMAAEAPEVESNPKADADMLEVELSYLDLITKTKEELKLSHVEATKHVMKEHPEAYAKFTGRK